MSTPPNTIKNILLRVTWNSIEFDCISKNLPAFKEAPTWTTVTDDPDYKTGTTDCGKPEGLEPIELSIPTVLSSVYGALQTAFLSGTEAGATFTYTPPSGTAVTVTVPKCTIIGLSPQAGDNNAGSSTTIKLQPYGGVEIDMPTLGS